MLRIHPKRIAVLLLLASLSGCASLGLLGSTSYEESPWYSGSEEVLWDATRQVLRREFRLGEVDEAEGTFETRWRERLSPFKGEGVRRQVVGKVERDGIFRRVKLQVLVEKNQEIDRPLERAAAKWRQRAEDPLQARVLLRHIHQILVQAGLSTAPNR